MSYTGVDGELPDRIRHYVACGFEDPQTVSERICEIFEDADEAEVDALVDEAFAARDQAAAAWPEVTDCDRLDRAFEVLETSGIVARHNFACCHNCGRDEIVDEIDEARKARRRVDGFVFYHMQDTDTAVTGGALHLRYDGTSGSETVAIGARIVAAMRDAGLAAKWNGDAAKTIEVALRWQRRVAPRATASTYTGAACVATWCTSLLAATLSAAAANAGEDFAVALDTAGLHAEALAWARAPFDEGDRAQAVARLAVARRSPELLVEAWLLAPWDDRTFVMLLCEAGLDNPQVRAIACDKIEEMRRDAYGGAAAAWLSTRAPELEWARDRARSLWDRLRDSSHDAGLVALAAGLWRAGDAALREPVMSKFAPPRDEWEQRAAIAGATNAEDLLALANAADVTSAADRLRCRALARLVEIGAVDAAREHAKARGAGYVAHVAWHTNDIAVLEAIAMDFDEYAMQHDEGLISATELRDLRIAVAAGTAEQQPARSRMLLGEIGATACAAALAEGRDAALAHLAGHAVDPDPGDVDGAPTTSNPTLDAAIAQWANDVPLRRRFRLRRSSRAMLAHAAAHARRGEVERARELVALVLAPLTVDGDSDDAADGVMTESIATAVESAGIADQVLEAWIALGELALVEQYAIGEFGIPRRLSCTVIGCYVPALLAVGERERGLALLGTALTGGSDAVTHAGTRRALLELVPAVLAVAGDAAEEVHAAWRRAEEALASLLPAAIPK